MARKRKNPLEWMPLYFRDLRTSETWRLMSHAQRGLYMELIGHQWEEESIPGDPALVAQLLHPEPDASDLERVLEQFPMENDGRRRNKRTADVRKTAMSQYRKQVKQAQTMRSVLSGSGLSQGLTQGLGQGVGEGLGASPSPSQSAVAVSEGIPKGNQTAGGVTDRLVARLVGQPNRWVLEQFLGDLPAGESPEAWAGVMLSALDGLGLAGGKPATVAELAAACLEYPTAVKDGKWGARHFLACVARTQRGLTRVPLARSGPETFTAMKERQSREAGDRWLAEQLKGEPDAAA